VVAVSYDVVAKPWKGGWELHIEGVGVTQSRTLPTAEQAVRDYVATIYDLDEVADPIRVTVALDKGVADEIKEARARSRDAEAAQKEAARKSRVVVHKLRRSGLSVTDTAAILGVSRGRISQLDKADPSETTWTKKHTDAAERTVKVAASVEAKQPRSPKRQAARRSNV
jgi:hypothetical protein